MVKRSGWLVLACALGVLVACGGDEDNGNEGGMGAGVGASGMGASGTGASGMGASGMGASGMGASGMGAGVSAGGTGAATGWPNQGTPNDDCIPLDPVEGDGAPLGECCHRASNVVRESQLGPDEPRRLEYRVQYAETINHPLTIGDPFIMNIGKTRYDLEEQSVLWTFIEPRQGGQPVAGEGTAIFGNGRYNCDGTHSYFSETAAGPYGDLPPPHDNPARWAPRIIPTTIDPTKTGRDRYHITWADTKNRDYTYTTFVRMGNYDFTWELVNQGFEILDADFSEQGLDCVGAKDGAEWVAGGHFRLFTPVELNSYTTIPEISMTYCHLTAFGLQNPPPAAGCDITPRCMPGTDGCLWVTLPDSLCPVTDEEKANWGCHIGDDINIENNGEAANCTAEAPTGVLDPDQGATSLGQCCNPMGDSAPNELPACNAWVLNLEYVLAATEITEERTELLPQSCVGGS